MSTSSFQCHNGCTPLINDPLYYIQILFDCQFSRKPLHNCFNYFIFWLKTTQHTYISITESLINIYSQIVSYLLKLRQRCRFFRLLLDGQHRITTWWYLMANMHKTQSLMVLLMAIQNVLKLSIELIYATVCHLGH